jgi:hypothetical protein
MVLGPLLAPRRWLEAIPAPFRILAGLGALAIGAFCGFGFLATFEPLDPMTQWGFRLLYSVAGLSAICGAVRLFRTSVRADLTSRSFVVFPLVLLGIMVFLGDAKQKASH